MVSDIWLRTILIVRNETRCRHKGYSFRLTASVLLYAPSHRQDSTYTAFDTPVVEQWLEREIDQWVHHEGSIRRTMRDAFCLQYRIFTRWHLDILIRGCFNKHPYTTLHLSRDESRLLNENYLTFLTILASVSNSRTLTWFAPPENGCEDKFKIQACVMTCPGQSNQRRPVPVPVTGVRYNSLLWMCTLNTLTWPDLTCVTTNGCLTQNESTVYLDGKQMNRFFYDFIIWFSSSRSINTLRHFQDH